MSTIDIVMASKKPKTIKKITEIDEANVKIEIEEIEDDEKGEKAQASLKEEGDEKKPEEEDDNVEEEEQKDDTDEEDNENNDDKEPAEEDKEPVIENFENEGSRFSWTKVLLFTLIAAITGIIIVGVYLFFIEGYNFTLTKEEAAEKTIDVEEELSPTPTPNSVDKSAFNILVLNGSGIAGEAANVQTLLTDEDFSVSDIGNAETADFTTTQILYKEDINKEFLDELEKVLETRGPTVLEEAPTDQEEDVVVIVGSELAEEDEEEPTPTPELE
jgi:hypothetical protein